MTIHLKNVKFNYGKENDDERLCICYLFSYCESAKLKLHSVQQVMQ